MTTTERKRFIENFQARRTSRLTHRQDGEKSGHYMQFHDKRPMVGQTLSVSEEAVLKDDWEPTEDAAGYVPGQSGSDPDKNKSVDLPTGVSKSGGDDIPKARVNRSNDGTTEPVHWVDSDVRNSGKPITVDISMLEKMSDRERNTVLRFVSKYPHRLVLGVDNKKEMVVDKSKKEETVLESAKPDGSQIFHTPAIPLSGPVTINLSR